MMIGALAVPGALRNCFASEKPSVSGIIASTNTRSNAQSAAAARSTSAIASLAEVVSNGIMSQFKSISCKMRRFVVLSSTTRTRRPRTVSLTSIDGAGVFETGKRDVKWKVLPSRGVLSTQIFPRICSTIFVQIPKPRPVPP